MIEQKDIDIVCQFIVVDNTLRLLNKELEAVEHSKLRIKKPHFNFILTKINIAHQDLQQLHREMKKRGIKIHESNANDYYVEYPFTCRGYFQTQLMQKDALKKRVIEKLVTLSFFS